jgi:hypothetical protein
MKAVLLVACLAVSACSSREAIMDARTAIPAYDSGDSAMAGYRQQEAAQFVEFCVELDSQDERVKTGQTVYQARVDPGLWNPVPVFDSRRAVAHDVARYAAGKDLRPDDEHWAKLYRETIAKARGKHGDNWTEQTLFDDPDLNGFGTWQTAWLLYEGRGPYAGAYAIAIRGTIFSSQPSVAEDAWFHTISSEKFLSPYVQFADNPEASLHSGFAHASFTAALDDRYGILRVLADRKPPPRTPLYIVGHSQGAAMATIVHAFLHYAMRNDETGSERFGLRGRNYRLKSYVFAQPKPGDYAFSADFAGITQRHDNALVINNAIDPVPKVPLSLQSIGDLDRDFSGGSFAVRTLAFASSFGSLFRRGVAQLSEPFVRDSAEGYSYFYNYDRIKPLHGDSTASTWNFCPAGHVLFVYGTPGDPDDLFLQHHAITYRSLLNQLAP